MELIHLDDPRRRNELARFLGWLLLAAVISMGLALLFQSAGARTERALIDAEKFEAIEFCKKDGLTAFMHVESGKVICGGGPFKKMRGVERQ